MAKTLAPVRHSLRLSFSTWLVAGLVLTGNGCRQHEHRTACQWSGGESSAADLPPGQRAKIEFDLSRLPSAVEQTAFSGTYRSLTEHDCQCLAAQASRLGSLLDRERGLVASHGRRRSTLQEAILETAALDARNKDAGTALELFYRLAEAEAKRDLLDDSLKRIGDAVVGGEKLKKQGLKVPPEFDEFHKQQIELQADSVRLDAAIEKLNRNLAKMMNLKLAPETERLWPAADFHPSGTVPSPDDAVAFGLEQRPEVALLRRAQQETNVANLAAARKLAAGSNVLLGLSGSGPMGKLKAILCANETGVRREQLEQLAAQRQTEIADEIRQAVLDLRTQTQLVVLAKVRAANAEAKFKDLDAKRAKGALSAVDVTPARLAWLKARGDLVHEVMAWHIARIKLKQAQGLLAAECGHDGHGSHPPPTGSEGTDAHAPQAAPPAMLPGETLITVPDTSAQPPDTPAQPHD